MILPCSLPRNHSWYHPPVASALWSYLLRPFRWLAYRVSTAGQYLDPVGITVESAAHGGATVTSNSHGLENGDVVVFSQVGTTPINFDNSKQNVHGGSSNLALFFVDPRW